MYGTESVSLINIRTLQMCSVTDRVNYVSSLNVERKQ